MLVVFLACEVLLLFGVRRCRATQDVIDVIKELNNITAPEKLNLEQTFFPSLENYHVNGQPATDKTYPWIAQVVHSRSRDVPYLCTAVCVHEGIFITASRCIISIKVQFTSVVYKSIRLPARAFVVPSKPTSQGFDDIGFIVIDSKGDVAYNAAALYPEKDVKRSDEVFKWFSKVNVVGPFKAVGYVTEKGIHKIKSAERQYGLKDLPIVVNMLLCPTILTYNNLIDGFEVPCYHSCTVAEFKKKDKKCQGYLGVEGAAVYNTKTKKILGLATWGVNYHKCELPVGFSVLHSQSFIEDFKCAKKIRISASDKSGSYKKLCT